MFVSTFGFYLKHEKLLKQSGELNCWQDNSLDCLLIHFKNSFPAHYYSSPATLFHRQEKDHMTEGVEQGDLFRLGWWDNSSTENVNPAYRVFF